MVTSNMIKEVDNSFGRYSSPFRKRCTDIPLENYLNSGKMCENVSRCFEFKDSVDDFINKHSLFIDEDVKQNSKFSNSTPNRHFDNELLVSTIIRNNIKLNKLLYTLVNEIEREKQNKISKRFIKLLKKEYDKDVDRNVSYPNECKSLHSKLSHSSSSQITSKLLKVLTNLYKERDKSNLRLHDNDLDERLRIHSSKTNKRYWSQPGQISSCDDVSMLRRERFVAYPNLCSSTTKRATKLRREQRSLPPSIHRVYSDEDRRYSDSKTNHLCQEKRKKQTVSDDKYDKRINKIDQPNFLPSIELKIENLIESINSFIGEIREQKIKEKRAISNASDIKSMNNPTKDLNGIKQLQIDTLNIEKSFSNKKCEITTQTDSNIAESCKTLKDKNIHPKKDKENITKSNQSKINIEENCYFISTFRTSFRERTTEITKSFLETQVQVSKTITAETSSSGPCMVEKVTKEANTEPLGVLALLRISTQTVKQLLSYLPTIDYYSYIPHLQFRCSKASGEPNYICNICGAAFDKAMMLNEHIKGHDLGSARDCAVCQHVLKSHKLHQELFKCQFCGQRFTRAYCCELHQQSCAKLLGLKHDPSNLILLQ